MNIHQALCAAFADNCNGSPPLRSSNVSFLFRVIQHHIDGIDESDASGDAPEELRYIAELMRAAARKLEKSQLPIKTPHDDCHDPHESGDYSWGKDVGPEWRR